MKAYIDHNFKRGFFLSEEQLIKLDDLIKKRINEREAHSVLEYKVYRADGLVYTTGDHKVVLAEENSSRNAITRLMLSYVDDNTNFLLDLDHTEGAKLKVEAADKDFAYLLFSDVKDYLTPEVLKFRSFRFKDTRVDRWMFPVLMLIVMATMLQSVATPRLNESQFHSLLSQGTVEQKVNYLLENSRLRGNIKNTWYIGLLVIFLAFAVELLLSSMDRFFPVNVFCTGKELVRYERLVEMRSKVIWGILISLSVSLVAGAIIAYLTQAG